MLCTANRVEATWKHVKVSLCAYNHMVNYRFYLAEHMLRALCRACHLDPSQCSRMLSEVWTGCIANVHFKEHTPLSLHSKHLFSVFAMPTTPTLTPCSFHLRWLTSATKELIATTAATSATFLAGKHHTLTPATTTATVMAALNAQPAKRRYLAKTVCLHFSGLSPLWLGFTRTYDASKWWPSALQMNTQMPCFQSVATASTRSRLCFVKWKLLRQVVHYSMGHFFIVYNDMCNLPAGMQDFLQVSLNVLHNTLLQPAVASEMRSMRQRYCVICSLHFRYSPWQS